MRIFKKFLSFFVVFSLLVVPFGFCAEALKNDNFDAFPRFPDVPYDLFPFEDLPNTYAAVTNYNYLSSNKFQFDNFATGDLMLYEEDLPYGADSIVVMFSCASNTARFVVILDGSDYASFSFERLDNGRLAFGYLGAKPLYGFTFNSLYNNYYNQFNGTTGLSMISKPGYVGSEQPYPLHYLNYTLSASDYYVTCNRSFVQDGNIYYASPLVNFDTTFPDLKQIVGYAKYPTRSSAETETSKGIWQSIKDGFSNVVSSFSALGDKIGSFFTNLKNWLLWFNAEGSSSYENPFENYTLSVNSFFNKQINTITSFTRSMSDSLTNVKAYIGDMFGFLDDFVGLSPILTAFMLFGVAFVVVRKVVGR